ncbi:OmpA family protein [Erysipelotrichia bacterium]
MLTNTENQEENYLASVSDIMSGLIFIFIITLMVFSLRLKGSQEDQEKENERLRKEIESYKTLQIKLEEEIEKYRNILTMLTGARGLRDSMLKAMEKSLNDKGFQVKIDTDHGVLSLPEQVLFPSGSDKLQLEGAEMLKSLAGIMYSNLHACTYDASGTSIFTGIQLPDNLSPSYIESIFIEGHTDNLPVGQKSLFRDNWDLSTARSLQTYKTLISAEPKLIGLYNESGYPIFSVSGYAEHRPVATNDTIEGRSLNRRIDIRIIMSPPRFSKANLQGVIQK